MPFARNEATRAISPTKTLEYLAGGKPVVSTPITDVIVLYGDVVNFAATGQEFVAATEAVLNRASDADRQWRARVARLVAAHDWDSIAESMLAVMSRASTPMIVPATQTAALTA
jgi:glycosyltransferase involved in cell wall biosynthesis